MAKKSEDFYLPLPSRRLIYLKLVQGERNGKKKRRFLFAIAEPPPNLLKISNASATDKARLWFFSIGQDTGIEAPG